MLLATGLRKTGGRFSYRVPNTPPRTAATTISMASMIIHRFRLHQGRWDGERSGDSDDAARSGMLETATSGALCSPGLSAGGSAYA